MNLSVAFLLLGALVAGVLATFLVRRLCADRHERQLVEALATGLMVDLDVRVRNVEDALEVAVSRALRTTVYTARWEGMADIGVWELNNGRYWVQGMGTQRAYSGTPDHFLTTTSPQYVYV